MTALGKLLAFLTLVAGLTMMTWAVAVYAQRPAWFAPAPEGGADKAAGPASFAGLKAEIDALGRQAAVASGTWGDNLRALQAREKFRAARRAGFAPRLQWAHTGNPKDLIDPANPRSGKGFYAPAVDPASKLYDLSLDAAGRPKGDPLQGGDGQPLPGVDTLTTSVTGDVKGIEALTAEVIAQRKEYDKLSVQVLDTERRLEAMSVIRNSVRAELFYLSTFEVNVYETRETVVRRERQLRNRFKGLGVIDP